VSDPVKVAVLVRVNGTEHELGHIVLEGEQAWPHQLADTLRSIATEFETMETSNKETT